MKKGNSVLGDITAVRDTVLFRTGPNGKSKNQGPWDVWKLSRGKGGEEVKGPKRKVRRGTTEATFHEGPGFHSEWGNEKLLEARGEK